MMITVIQKHIYWIEKITGITTILFLLPVLLCWSLRFILSANALWRCSVLQGLRCLFHFCLVLNVVCSVIFWGVTTSVIFSVNFPQILCIFLYLLRFYLEKESLSLISHLLLDAVKSLMNTCIKTQQWGIILGLDAQQTEETTKSQIIRWIKASFAILKLNT